MVSAVLAAPFRCPKDSLFMRRDLAQFPGWPAAQRTCTDELPRIAMRVNWARRRGSRDAHPVRVGLYPHADMNKLTHDIGGHEQDGLAAGLAGSPPLAPELTRPVPGRRFVRNSMTLAPTWLYEVIDLAAMLLKHRV